MRTRRPTAVVKGGVLLAACLAFAWAFTGPSAAQPTTSVPATTAATSSTSSSSTTTSTSSTSSTSSTTTTTTTTTLPPVGATLPSITTTTAPPSTTASTTTTIAARITTTTRAVSSTTVNPVLVPGPASTASTIVRAPAAAGNTPTTTITRVIESSAGAEVRRYVRLLVVIAILTGLFTVLFWWHTRPKVRLRAAAKRQAKLDARAAALAAAAGESELSDNGPAGASSVFADSSQSDAVVDVTTTIASDSDVRSVDELVSVDSAGAPAADDAGAAAALGLRRAPRSSPRPTPRDRKARAADAPPKPPRGSRRVPPGTAVRDTAGPKALRSRRANDERGERPKPNPRPKPRSGPGATI